VLKLANLPRTIVKPNVYPPHSFRAAVFRALDFVSSPSFLAELIGVAAILSLLLKSFQTQMLVLGVAIGLYCLWRTYKVLKLIWPTSIADYFQSLIHPAAEDEESLCKHASHWLVTLDGKQALTTNRATALYYHRAGKTVLPLFSDCPVEVLGVLRDRYPNDPVIQQLCEKYHV